jgi:hypothetical protein
LPLVGSWLLQHATSTLWRRICMYGKSASSEVEAMNCANNSIRRRTAVDIVNAIIVLLKKESNHFERSKSDAWKRDVYHEEKLLSPCGMTLLSEIFDKCDTALFQISLSESTSHYIIKICKHSSPNREYMVTIPKDGGTHGLRFGTCTCGFP